MKDSVYSLPVSFSVQSEVSNEDTRFLKCTIDVMNTGANYNGSYFTKEVVEENIETIKNTPILGYIREMPDGEYDFKGHEYIITKDENGVCRKNIGSVWGVIPESCNPRFINKTLDTGEEVETLQVDAILWQKMEDAVDIMLRDIEKSQSMELQSDSIEGYDNPDDGLFHFTKFSFDGCTILGRDIDPAMADANITIEVIQFSMSDFVKNIQSELNNKYSEFAKLTELANDTAFTKSIDMVDEKNKGGIETMENTDFSTVLQMFDDVSAIIAQHEMIEDRWGDKYPRYYAVDIQENEVVVVDRMNNYNYFGFSFTVNGDSVEVDFESGKRKKVSYEDYVDGSSIENAFNFGKHIEEIENNAFTKIEEANTKLSEAESKASEYETKVSEFEIAKNEIEEKYNQVNAEFQEMKPKYDDYVKAEQLRIEAELDAQKDAEFAKYESVLTDNVEFESLKEKKSEMTVKEIESECAILYARKNLAQANFSKYNDGVMTAGIINSFDDSDTDDMVQTKKYGPIRRNR